MEVRCNWCESVFDKSKIIVKEEVEYCPDCNETGYLMDLHYEKKVRNND